MKSYGLKPVEAEFDSKKDNRRPWRPGGTSYAATGSQNALRVYKKAARREGKASLNEEG